jgi:hypothetical protein
MWQYSGNELGGFLKTKCAAAAQGLVAGLNAARRAQGQEPVALPRTGSYIGTLIDDLVTKVRASGAPHQGPLAQCRIWQTRCAKHGCGCVPAPLQQPHQRV